MHCSRVTSCLCTGQQCSQQPVKGAAARLTAAWRATEALQAYTKAVDLHRQSRAQQAAAAAKAARRAWKAEARAAVAEGSSPPPEPPPLPSQPQA